MSRLSYYLNESHPKPFVPDGYHDHINFQYVLAKLFEIPSTEALLAVNPDVKPLLAAPGMKEGEQYLGFDRQDPEAIIWWVNDPQNWPDIDRIRRAGMELVREQYLVTNRVKALDLFMMTGETAESILS
ncbi:hypothetical protein PsorP6_008330 [Peronosclerospora sorghi]|uniref:Uncharacterized protein n=1 Tax=Peronosclerospora sorghi TaxID=230839 RepID=A0ACC0W8A9_9STRA|nr:hypothetical protein PsorP6_008330 [Peronosclerospora sorghi]